MTSTSKECKIGQTSFKSLPETLRINMSATGVCYAAKRQIPSVTTRTRHPKRSVTFQKVGLVLEETGNSLPGYWVSQGLMAPISVTFVMDKLKILRRGSHIHPGCCRMTPLPIKLNSFQSVALNPSCLIMKGLSKVVL